MPGWIGYPTSWRRRSSQGPSSSASLLLFVNVVMRYVFLLPIYWAEEFVRYLMVWLIFIGASQVTLWGGHVAVDIVPRVLSKRGNAVLAFIVNVICILFCILLAYLSIKQMMRVKGAGQISPALEIPMWIAYLSIPAGTILMLIRFRSAALGADSRQRPWKSGKSWIKDISRPIILSIEEPKLLARIRLRIS